MTHEATSPVALDDPDDGPKWVEVLRTGMQKSRFVDGASESGHTGVEFTREDLESMVRGFAIAQAEGFFPGGRAVVGYEHAEFRAALKMVRGEDPGPEDVHAAAAGFDAPVVELNDDGGYSLMAKHHYTEDGRKRVRSGAFAGYSIDLAPPGTTQRADGTPIDEWVPFGGTLTNKPFVKKMQQVAASDAVPAQLLLKIRPPMETPMTDAFDGILGLTEGKPEDRIAAIIALKDEAAKVAGLDAKVVALTENVDKLAGDVTALTSERDSLVEREQKRIGDDAVTAGRVALADVAEYMKAFTLLGEAHANKVYPSDKISVAPVVLTDGTVVETTSSEDAEGRIFDECVSLRDDLVKQGIPGAEAWVRAQQEVSKDPAKAEFINPTTTTTTAEA